MKSEEKKLVSIYKHIDATAKSGPQQKKNKTVNGVYSIYTQTWEKEGKKSVWTERSLIRVEMRRWCSRAHSLPTVRLAHDTHHRHMNICINFIAESTGIRQTTSALNSPAVCMAPSSKVILPSVFMFGYSCNKRRMRHGITFLMRTLFFVRSFAARTFRLFIPTAIQIQQTHVYTFILRWWILKTMNTRWHLFVEHHSNG